MYAMHVSQVAPQTWVVDVPLGSDVQSFKRRHLDSLSHVSTVIYLFWDKES